MSRTLLRRAAGLGAAFLFLDLLFLLLSGSSSLLDFGRTPVGAAGLLLRLLLLGLALVLRFRVLAEGRLRLSRATLALVLLLLPALAELQLAGGRLGGDGVMYFVYTRSLFFDRDLDFTNEYEHFGLLSRGDLAMPTDTGLRRSIFAVGPGLLMLPLYALGHGVALLQSALGAPVKVNGFSSPYSNAAALSGLLAGFAALLLVHSLLRRHFRPGLALGATLLLWGGSFLHWYMVQQPTMSHAFSACAAALALWTWDRTRQRRSPLQALGLGLLLGFGMCVRWQNGVLLLLPALDLWAALREARRAGQPWGAALRPMLRPAAALGAGALLGAVPQMWAWKVIYGEWLLRYPPHGAGFLRLGHPWVLETLFSSRHGLLSWTPVLWAGYLGFLPLLRRRPQLAWPLLLPLLAMTYVNMCSGDWWAGGSFSNRRFDSLLPLFALGLAAALEWGLGLLRRRPELALVALGLPLVAFNLALAEQLRLGLVARDDTVDFPDLVRGGWSVMAAAVGSPNTWPASWLFALRHGRPPGQYDLLVGRYLFYRQNNLDGHVPVGQPGDEPYLGEGWARRESLQGLDARRVRGRARLFLALDEPEDLELRVRLLAPGPREVRVSANGQALGRLAAGSSWGEGRLGLPARALVRELNELGFETEGDDVAISGVTLLQRGRP